MSRHINFIIYCCTKHYKIVNKNLSKINRLKLDNLYSF